MSMICPPPYLMTLHGILNIVEIVLSILTFALSFGGGDYWNSNGGGWVEFVGILSLILITIILILHILNVVPAFIVQYQVELIIYISLAIMFLIAGIVAAAKSYNDSVKACSFFAFATMATLGADAGLRMYRNMRGQSSNSESGPSAPTNSVPPEYTSSNAVY